MQPPQGPPGGYGQPPQQQGYGQQTPQGYGAQQPPQGYPQPPGQQPGYAGAQPPAAPEPEKPKVPGYEKLKAVGIIMILFGIVSLITSAFFTMDAGKPVTFQLPAQGGTVGPITTKQKDTVLLLDVSQYMNENGWIFVEGEVQNADEEYLFGFGDELWHESGYDEGPWTEWHTDFDLKVTLPDEGTYYLGFTTQSKPPATAPIVVKVEQKVGSTVPHFAAGLLGLIFGFIVFRIAAKQAEQADAPSWLT